MKDSTGHVDAAAGLLTADGWEGLDGRVPRLQPVGGTVRPPGWPGGPPMLGRWPSLCPRGGRRGGDHDRIRLRLPGRTGHRLQRAGVPLSEKSGRKV